MSFLPANGDADADDLALSELLEAVDEWVGRPRGAQGLQPLYEETASLLAHLEPVTTATESSEADAVTNGRAAEDQNGSPVGTGAARTPPVCNKRRRARDPAVDVRRRLRRKAEPSLLRVEVRDLELQLTALRREHWLRGLVGNVDKHLGGTSESKEPDAQIEDGDRQRQALQLEHRRAEADHRRLSAHVAKNNALLRSLSSAIRSGARYNEDAVLLAAAASCPSASSVEPDVRESDAECAPCLETAVLDVDCILEKFPPLTADSLVCDSGIAVDAFGLPRFEMKTATTLGCGIQSFGLKFTEKFYSTSTFARMMLRCLTTNQRVVQHTFSREVRYLNSTITMRSRAIVYKHGLENGDIVFSLSSKMSHPGGVLGFRGRSWIIVTRSPYFPDSMTTLRALYELTPEQIPSGIASIDGESPEIARASLLRVLSEHLRAKLMRLQRTLLVETGRSDLAAVLGM